MNSTLFNLRKMTSSLLVFSLSLLFGSQLTFAAALNGSASSSFDMLPPAIQTPEAKPIVMLVMGNDHQLFYKAYNDWSDLDNDDTIDAAYKNSIDYYGYFDSYKCYQYDQITGRFSPKATTTDKYCTGANLYWSGNFLNWATMTRMDVVRKVLYGGKRSTDTATLTVLERAHLPTDAHSFAKYYNGADIADLTPFSAAELTMCNTTYASGALLDSEDVTDPPLLRVASGDFRYWNANERWQCTWDDERGDRTNGTGNTPASASTSDPNRTTNGLQVAAGIGPDYIVRVESCVSAALTGQEKCKNYTSSLKPTGLLHTYGETEAIQFGLLTGSYAKNKSGGVVRKDISTFTDEVNSGTDGTFTGVAGIVQTLDAFRIVRYRYGDADGNGRYNDPDNCSWGISAFTEGDCSNWGNPASEMYLEAVRYFADLGRNTNFSTATTDDDAYITGLTNVGTWTDPFAANNYCSSCNIIMINTSDLSYDSDALDMTGLTGSPVATTLTNSVGTYESISGNDWFVGETASDTDQLCTAKAITDLGVVKGTCPGSPRLEGTYNIAGIAHWAHITDIRALTGDQKVNTYAVALSPNVPQIKIPVPGSTEYVTILPACRNTSLTPEGNCAIVNFSVVADHTETAPGSGTFTGGFHVHWEDSEQGGDYDQDMKGTIFYSINSTSIDVTTDVDGESTPYSMGFGYIISGTTQDGFHVHSGIENFTYNDPDNTIIDCQGPSCNLADAATTETYTIGTSSASLLQDPLWYAAKWGNFRDQNNNNRPDLTSEWDVQNNDTGAYTPDGIPDSYYLVNNPKFLESQLDKSLKDILQRTSSGTAAAVIADTVSMTGAVVQALYQPRLLVNGDTISWAGMVHSVFIDEYGNLREDTDQDGRLDAPATDKYIQIKYSVDVARTQVYYCTSTDGGLNLTCPLADRKEVEDLKPIWNVRDTLADVPDSRITIQRAYTDPFLHSSTGGRHIITWLDNDTDNLVDSGETVAFTTTSITSSNYTVLNSDSETEADNIVDFIRGKEGITGFRPRTIDYDNDTVKEAWRLGDIVHSTPLIVSQPSEKWDVLSGDDTYTAFRAQYANRRNVVYVGANDGMLHAINAGFFDTYNNRFCRAANCTAQTNDSAHPLGAELWAYVPKNLLPHLRWLGEADYPHVFYMDGKAQSFDVNIFPVDTDHPDGWGTILVAGMRLGGGDLGVDIDADATNDYTARSGYVILDITNPEVAPKVLGEFTHEALGINDLGYTTSTPTLVVKREPDAANDWTEAGNGTLPNDWYLVFGSGPDVLNDVTSTLNAQLFMVKLVLDATSGTLDFATAGNVNVVDTLIGNSFVGDPASVDWSSDFLSDAVYFGIAGGTVAAPTGKLYRLKLEGNTASDWDMSKTGILIDSGQPFINKPELVSNDDYPYNQWWVYAGTGRLYVPADNTTTAQQSFYGIREVHDTTYPEDYPDTGFTATTGPYTDTNYAQNVTGIKVFADGSVTIPLGLQPEFTTLPTLFTELETHIDTKKGWYLNFSTSPVATRSLTKSTFWRDFVLFTSYTPPTDTCTPEGYSDLYALYGATGTAHPTAGLDILDNTTQNNGVGEKLPSTYLSIGIASEITTYDTLKGTKPIIQMSTGEIVDSDTLTGLGIAEGRQSWRELQF